MCEDRIRTSIELTIVQLHNACRWTELSFYDDVDLRLLPSLVDYAMAL
jgi:hypothetical protein